MALDNVLKMSYQQLERLGSAEYRTFVGGSDC